MPAGNDSIVAGSAGSFVTPFGPGGSENISGGGGINIPGGQTNDVLVNYGGVGPGASTWHMVDGINTLEPEAIAKVVTDCAHVSASSIAAVGARTRRTARATAWD